MTDDSRPRLTRSDDRKLGGVAAGLAEYVDVDPTLIRVLFVLAFFLGFGTILLAYIVFWFVMPEQDDADPSRPAVSFSVGTTDPGLLLGGALVVIGALLLLNELAIDRWFGFGFLTVAWPVLLIAGGLALVLRARDRVAR